MVSIVPLLQQNNDNDNSIIKKPLPNFMNNQIRLLAFGSAGSGKTNALMNMLLIHYIDENKNSLFDKIYILSASLLQDPIWKLLKSNPDIEKKTYATTEFDEELINKLINTEPTDTSKKERILLWIDDHASDRKKMKSESILGLAYRSRHAGLSWWITGQYLFAIPPPVLQNATHLMLWKPSNNSDIPIMKYYMSTPQFHDAYFDQALENATNTPHGFLYIDRSHVPYRFYASFEDELLPRENNNLM
jgi:hypothetical protein